MNLILKNRFNIFIVKILEKHEKDAASNIGSEELVKRNLADTIIMKSLESDNGAEKIFKKNFIDIQDVFESSRFKEFKNEVNQKFIIGDK